jgi:hypothetical protein
MAITVFKDGTPKKDPNLGMHTYEGSECANIGIGQNGFDVVADASDYLIEDGTLSSTIVGNWTRGWVAIKVIGGNECVVEGTSNSGAHLTADGGAPTGSNGITISDTDTVYGNFSKVFLQTKGSNSILVCYRG